MTVVKTQVFKLLARAALLAVLAIFCAVDASGAVSRAYAGLGGGLNLISLLWAFLMLEAILRFFPSRYESMGCQKHFRSRLKAPPEDAAYDLAEDKTWKIRANRGALFAAAAWVLLNAGVAVIYFSGLIDEAGLFLIAAFYSVCDIVCILFFCPFQAFIMKNRCCVDCRIFNWDYFMLCTPLLFVKSFFSWSLCLVSAALLIKWEYTFWKNPERFSEHTNENLKCKNCREKLCRYKITRLLSRKKTVKARR